jgi:diguanylate cyclase (GGDEF)-like protein
MTQTACKPPLVLIADDDELGRMFLVETLEAAGFSTACAVDGVAALQAIAAEPFALVLLDVEMPGLDGYEVCRRLRSNPAMKYLPVVMITGNDDATSIERAFNAGATDFIAKPLNFSLLPHRVRYVLRNAEADARLRHAAYHDALTGLPNSHALIDMVSLAIKSTDSGDGTAGVALLHLDVHGCGRIRSTFGPDEGDQALRALAVRLQTQLATVDRASIARIDGDRFIVILSGDSIRQKAIDLAEGLQRALDNPVACADHQFFLNVAVGIALSPEYGQDPKALITFAAAAKHHAISTAAATVVYSNDIGDRARERLSLEESLRHSVRTEELALYFQPKIRVADGSLVGVEALLRWHDHALGDVSPDRFIGLAEESGLILQIGRWVAQSACRTLAHWRERGLATSIAINVSARQFVHDNPAEFIRAAALASDVDPAWIMVEITESALIQDFAAVQQGLLDLRELGCKVAIDDFGTGYSSLAYLKGLPVDQLKIDKAFIHNVHSNPVDAAICMAILSMARHVGLGVTAEGVETSAQLDWLRLHGCAEAQGFLIARPMAAPDVLARYAAARRDMLTGS